MPITVIEQHTHNAIQRACNAIVKHVTEADWEQRRYETAKDVLATLITMQGAEHAEHLCITSVNIADRFINILRQPRTE